MSKPLWSRIRKQQCEHTSRQWIQTLESGILHEHSVVIPEVEINCWMPIQSYSISLQNLHLISSNIHITFCVEAVAVRPLGCRRCKHQLLRQGRRFFPFAYLVNLVVCFFIQPGLTLFLALISHLPLLPRWFSSSHVVQHARGIEVASLMRIPSCELEDWGDLGSQRVLLNF